MLRTNCLQLWTSLVQITVLLSASIAHLSFSNDTDLEIVTETQSFSVMHKFGR